MNGSKTETVVTVEPDHVFAEIIDGPLRMGVNTGDVRLHLQVPDDGPTAVLAIEADAGDFQATIELSEADAHGLTAGFGMRFDGTGR